MKTTHARTIPGVGPALALVLSDLALSSVAKFLAIFEKCNVFPPECATYLYHNGRIQPPQR